jgi:hypothetical protein
VLLDAELAALYGVTTKRLNEQVKRNAAIPIDPGRDGNSEPVAKCDRFPEALRFAPQVLATRSGDQFFKVANCALKDQPRPHS